MELDPLQIADPVGTISQGAIIFPGLKAGWLRGLIVKNKASYISASSSPAHVSRDQICTLGYFPQQQGCIQVPQQQANTFSSTCLISLLTLHPKAVGKEGYTALSLIKPRDSSSMALAACPQRCYLHSALLVAWPRCSLRLH